jgi:glycosyltransferase involved in cell wall biosynthesis
MLINGRFLTQQFAGVQRHGLEVSRALLRMLPGAVRVLTPSLATTGIVEIQEVTRRLGSLQGQAWEQLTLARYCRRDGGLLLSPANLGPLAVPNQLVTLHDVFALTRPQWVGRRFRAWYRFLVPRLVSRVRGVLTVSEYSRAQICETLGVPEDRVHVIYNGVSASMKRQSRERIERVRLKYRLPEHYVLGVGSIEPRKNLRGLIEGWKMLPATGRPALVVAGAVGSPDIFRHAGVDEFAGEPGIFWPGFIDEEDLAAIYSAAAVMAHVAFEEGFGIPPMEAACCETPIVVGDNSALREIAGPYAVKADAADPESIAVALGQALGSPPSPEQRGRWADEIHVKYSWDAVASGVLAAARPHLPAGALGVPDRSATDRV